MANRPEHTLQNKGKLIVSKELQSKILYLHSQVKDVEWSGWLIYKIVEGSVSRPSTLVCEAVDLVAKNVGNASYTEYEFDASDVEIYETYPGLMTGELKRGHIHTHL